MTQPNIATSVIEKEPMITQVGLFLFGHRPNRDGISATEADPIPQRALYRNGRIQYNM